MSKFNILMILINHRKDSANKVQALLTKHWCSIKTRVGLHETTSVCAEDGLIILQLENSVPEIIALENGLKSLDGVKVHFVSMDSN